MSDEKLPAVRILSTAEIFAPMSAEDSATADEHERIHEKTGAWPAGLAHDVETLRVELKNAELACERFREETEQRIAERDVARADVERLMRDMQEQQAAFLANENQLRQQRDHYQAEAARLTREIAEMTTSREEADEREADARLARDEARKERDELRAEIADCPNVDAHLGEDR